MVAADVGDSSEAMCLGSVGSDSEDDADPYESQARVDLEILEHCAHYSGYSNANRLDEFAEG